MTKLRLADNELNVAQDLEEVLGGIAGAATRGPSRAGVPTLPPGWMVVRDRDLGEDLYVQTSAILYVRSDSA